VSVLTNLIRLLEFAALYFDISSFPDGETKRALTRVQNKRLGKVDSRFGGNGSGSDDGRKKKKQKKN
jgi:pre-mRNA-splicing factor ATP-dependent RNA helicase DHX15/PRP43